MISSTRPIGISSNPSDDRSYSSRSIDVESWKLEKVVDHHGRSNYKVLLNDPTIKKKSRPKKSASPNRSIGAYGVPAGNAYLNHKASVLSSAVVPTRQVRRIEPVKRVPVLPFREYTESSSIVVSRRVSGRVAQDTDYILGFGGIHPYEEKDLFGAALEHGDVLSSARLTGLGAFLTGSEETRVSLSLWFISLQSSGSDLTRIAHFDLRSTPQNYHFVQKKLDSGFASPGVVFLTIHVPRGVSGDISLYAAIHHNVSTLRDESLTFQKPSLDVPAEPAVLPEAVLPEAVLPDVVRSDVVQPAVLQDAAGVKIPTLPKTIFGDFILEKTKNNIPIFGTKKTVATREDDKADQVEQTNLTTLQQSSAPAPDGIVRSVDSEELEFSEKNDQDIYRLLDSLRDQHQKSKEPGTERIR